jgi:ectoine hydroxylase-related dioxygenase (phytanoyl-CoA dioxygenase family)
MSELRKCGFIVIDGPFSFNEIAEIARDYDHSLAVTPDAQMKRGRTSARWGGLVALKPFNQIYLHPPLLSAASERIGGPMKLSSFCARTLLPNVAADSPHQDVAPGADGYPLVGFIFMVDEFRSENGATRFIAGSQDGPRPPADAPARDACGPAGSMLIFDGTTWHGHGANRTDTPRRSIQGAFIPQNHTAACCWADELSVAQANGLAADARGLLSL